MLPTYPFYHSLRRLRLRATNVPGQTSHSAAFSPPHRAWYHSTRVFVRFRIKAPTLEGHTASVSINDSASYHGISVSINDSASYHGLPLTMVNITPLLSSPEENFFTVWGEAIPTHATVHVNVVEIISEDKLLRSLNGSHSSYVHKIAETKALISANFLEDQLVVEHLQVSLICQLAQKKIRVPCRGVRCHHVQCFDAIAYLDLNESTLQPPWCCPLCNDQVFVQDIRVDLFTLDVLRTVHDECNAVVLKADGSWEPLAPDTDTSVTVIGDSPYKASRDSAIVIVIDLTCD